MNDRCFEESSRPEDVEVAEAPKALLVALGAIKARGRPKRSGRWRPFAESDDVDERDAEAVKLLVEHFGGHDPVLLHNGTLGIWRPDKSVESASAVVGYIGPGVTKVWSSHWPPFEQGKVYDLGTLRSMAGLTVIEVPEVPYELPPGYRIWQEGDEAVPAPELSDDVYHGLIGDYLQLIAGRTEAPAATVGIYLVACFGTMLGRSVVYAAPPHLHYPKVFVAVVGPTSSGAKDVSRTVAMTLIKAIDPAFVATHSLAGLGSGERLIHEVRDIDPDSKADQKPTEKRRIVLDSELSAVLRIVRREGSVLGDHLRQAFDNDPLRHSTMADKTTVASDHHISLIGGITPAELAGLVDETAIFNGFLNRFLFVWSELGELHPFGGDIPGDKVKVLVARFDDVRQRLGRLANISGTRQILTIKDEDARDMWRSFYSRRQGVGDSDLMRAITGRQVAHAARIAVVYAALAGADSIGVAHLRAAIGWCDYSIGSIGRVFTDIRVGRVGQLLAAIREKGADGLDGAGQDLVFGKNLNAGALAELRQDLESRHLIVTASIPSGGRPRLVSYAISPTGVGGQRFYGLTEKGN